MHGYISYAHDIEGTKLNVIEAYAKVESWKLPPFFAIHGSKQVIFSLNIDDNENISFFFFFWLYR